MSTTITHTRDGVSVKQALSLLTKARKAYVWVRACAEDGVTVEITKAQARRIVLAVAEDFPGENVLAWIDTEGDFRIN